MRAGLASTSGGRGGAAGASPPHLPAGSPPGPELQRDRPKEIAAASAIAPKTVENQIGRALKTLRERLAKCAALRQQFSPSIGQLHFRYNRGWGFGRP